MTVVFWVLTPIRWLTTTWGTYCLHLQIFKTTRPHNPEDQNPHFYYHENLTSPSISLKSKQTLCSFVIQIQVPAIYYLNGIIMDGAKIQCCPLCHMDISVIHTGDEVAESIG